MSIPATAREYRLPEFKGPESLQLSEGSVRKPKSFEVLVKVGAVSLNARDVQIASSTYPSPCPTGIVPGSDMAGTVVAVGEDVSTWNVGDRVCANFSLEHLHGDPTPESQQASLGGAIDGVLREYITVPHYSLVRIPRAYTLEEASTLPCAALTAYNALHGPNRLKSGDTVLVIGTGGVSIFGLQIAAAAGAEVIAISSSDAKLQKAKSLGAHHLINYKSVADWEKEVMKITKGRGVDHVIEIGGAGTLSKSVASVRMGGYVHIIGYLAGSADLSEVPVQLIGKGCILRGIHIGSVQQFEDMNRSIDVAGWKPAVHKVFSFADAKEAYKYLDSQKHVGKVVIKVAKE